MPVGQYHREYETTWSAKHMINSIYGVNGNVPNQTMAEKMIDIWKNACQDPLVQKMTYDDIWKMAAKIR